MTFPLPIIFVAYLLGSFLNLSAQTLPVNALGSATVSEQPGQVLSWVTLTDKTKLLAPHQAAQFSSGVRLPIHIEVDSSIKFQEMLGFGANISDASAQLINRKLSADTQKKLLEDLFGPSPGAAFSFTRLTIGASDFSTRHYTYDDMPAGQRDDALVRFSIDAMREDVLPVLKSALRINPQLKVMASPWSAPGWMKTTDSLIKGTLRPDAYDAYARYLGKYADAMEQEGIPLHALTLQNEPHFEPDNYPGMRLMPETRAKLIAENVGPLLQQRKKLVRILDWDHNWDEFNSPLAVLANDKARAYVAGVAWHCYGGDVKAQNLVHDAYPDKDTYFTECSGGEWKPHWEETLPWYMRHLIIGTTRGWAKGVLLWNIALDEKFGPHLGGCNDCRGVVTIDSQTGEVILNFDYYALAHASRFVRPGAHRIESSFGQEGIETVAFQNADDHSIVLVVLNGATSNRQFSVASQGQSFSYELPAASVLTLTWKPW
jgi:glucosylceramidase